MTGRPYLRGFCALASVHHHSNLRNIHPSMTDIDEALFAKRHAFITGKGQQGLIPDTVLNIGKADGGKVYLRLCQARMTIL